MDVTNTTPRRLQVAVELFLTGRHPLAYEGVVLWKDENRALHINSYSEFEPENTTRDMALEKIRRAKLVLEDLCRKSPALKEIASRLPHEHYFCYDYGTGPIALAKEVGDMFVWCHQESG
jgi:hypothetical protein